MKIGLLACSSKTGLGYQTRHFYDYIKPAKTLIYDISQYNGMPVDHSWCYTDKRIAIGIPSNADMEWLVDGMDIVFLCETPLNYHLFEYARQWGVKTVNQYNYEFLEYFRNNALAVPDILAAPSYWNTQRVIDLNMAKVQYWPVPIDTSLIPFRKMDKVDTFVHIIGRPTAEDRNGSIQFLEAIKTLGKRFKYKIYLQPPFDARAVMHFEPVRQMLEITKEILGDNLEVIENTPNNADMYASGEVLVIPRKYGGLCLPMWEGLSAGMPVIMTNVSPNDKVLPKEWLVNAKLNGTLQTSSLIDLYECNPLDLVQTMLWMYSNITQANEVARQLADDMSWEKQAPIYMQRFREIYEDSSIHKHG